MTKSESSPETTSCCSQGTCGAAPEPAPRPIEGTLRIHIDGLCCDDEATLVRRLLEKRDGVSRVDINLVGRLAYVTHDDRADPAALIAVLNEAHLGASLGPGEDAAVPPRPWALGVASVLFLVSLGSVWLPLLKWAALAAVVVGLPPILVKARVSLTNRLLDMNVLMTLAVIGALLIGEWVEGAAVVVLFAIAEHLERRSLDRATRALAEVASLAPETALLADGQEVPADSVPAGSAILIQAGSRVPLDGVVTGGRSGVDESALTGESVPVSKGPGDRVSAGTVNQAGVLEVETTATSGDSAVARLVRLVEQAQAQRSPVERTVDRFARVYTPVVVLGAVALALVPPLFDGDWAGWSYQSLVLLVIACPCALVLATPVSVVSALTRAARRGVLIRGGAHLETLGRLDTMAMDKTGTLTEGRFEVVDCLGLGDHDAAEVHQLLAAVEARSSHPLAAALRDHAGTGKGQVSDDEILPGEGVRAMVDGKEVHVGNHRLAERLGWHEPGEHATYEAWKARGRTVVYVGVDGRLAGLHGLADVPRPEAKGAVQALQAEGLTLVMLTGDESGAAEVVQEELGLDEVRAGLLPEDKVAAVTALRQRGPIAMIGDGINDGPALAAADVGVAMGVRGSALALETADVALMTDDLGRLAELVRLGRRARRVIRQNIAFSLAVKGAVLLLALAGSATLWAAVLADVGASLLVVLHGMTLLGAPASR